MVPVRLYRRGGASAIPESLEVGALSKGWRSTAMNATLLETADSILYISALLADQPRAIDRLIDYFGEAPAGTRPRRVERPVEAVKARGAA
jgi:hypothetical protein